MRAAAILGLGCSSRDLQPFQDAKTGGARIDWRFGMPTAADQVDVILLFGGDGTIHRHLGQLVRLGLPVLIIPAGSGNDFACSLGLPRVRDSLTAWRKFCGGEGPERVKNVRSIDLGVISAAESMGATPGPLDCRYFCCVAGVGLDGEVARRANRLPRWLRGHGGYVLSLAPTIFSFSPLPMRILTPVESKEAGNDEHSSWTIRSDQPTLLAAFANTPSFGGGMRIAPQAEMDDGLLDVCIVGAVDPFKLLCMFPTIYSGRHVNIREVQYFQSGRARIETEHPLDVYADGEFVCHTPVEVSVHPAGLKVVTA